MSQIWGKTLLLPVVGFRYYHIAGFTWAGVWKANRSIFSACYVLTLKPSEYLVNIFSVLLCLLILIKVNNNSIVVLYKVLSGAFPDFSLTMIVWVDRNADDEATVWRSNNLPPVTEPLNGWSGPCIPVRFICISDCFSSFCVVSV